MNSVKRDGVYATIINDSKILLVLKKNGPYKGLWDLPGGGIEEGESHLDTLKREISEELALTFETHEFIQTVKHKGIYNKEDTFTPYEFQHTGYIFTIQNLKSIPHIIPEEQFKWHHLKKLIPEILTPIAKKIIFF